MASEQSTGGADRGRPKRLDEVVGQDEVFVIKSPTGRAGNKIHLQADCQSLRRDDTTVVSKPAASYPVGFHEICGKCSTDTDHTGGEHGGN